MASMLAVQPVKGAYVLVAVTFEAVKLPFWIFSYLFRSRRPHPQWTFKQSVMVHLIRAFLFHCSKINKHVPLSLKPGAEKDRFVTLDPADSSLYTGPMLLLPDQVKPSKIGGTWYPKLPSDADLQRGGDIVLHFHGGAYTLGDGRKQDCAFAARNFLEHSKASFVFCPQYRLASYPTRTPFPGALQDALTSYQYLLRTRGVAPGRIIFSGDSAGANLALALLRYIASFPRLAIPPPSAAWLWSPWVSPHQSLDPTRAEASPLAPTDYISGAFAEWGARSYIPASLVRAGEGEGGGAEVVGYISPLGRPFKAAGVPLFVSVGEVEMLMPDGLKLAEEMKSEGNEVEVDVQKAAAHDYTLIGNLLGMEASAVDAATKAGEWARKVRSSSKL